MGLIVEAVVQFVVDFVLLAAVDRALRRWGRIIFSSLAVGFLWLTILSYDAGNAKAATIFSIGSGIFVIITAGSFFAKPKKS
ncbi:MAG: hypothetical protein HYZ04_03805 [Rhodospirillales bacterium]|nr:hypothetical protein [Rhodospirillales bacterium]MBI2977608.1 hypothetical protein [Rhodospirillales bacterium]MBI3113624.1 hypothetical protein [Rhodospirillales bacterium]